MADFSRRVDDYSLQFLFEDVTVLPESNSMALGIVPFKQS